MIKVKLIDLLNSASILQRLTAIDFKAKTSWQIYKLIAAAEKEMNAFQDTRMKVVQKYAEKDENGEMVVKNDEYKIPDDQMENFTNEINELLMSEVELNASPIPLEDLDAANFKPTEMIIMEPFLKIEE